MTAALLPPPFDLGRRLITTQGRKTRHVVVRLTSEHRDVRNHAACKGFDECRRCARELSRSVHRLDQVSRSLAPEDGVGSFVEVVE